MSTVYCRGCGKEVHETAKTCPSCGAPQNVVGNKHKVVVAIFIGIAMIGILAVVAIPAFQDYVARRQVTEGLTLAGSQKTYLADYYAANKSFSGISSSDLHGSTSGDYVDSMTLEMADGDTVVIVTTFKRSGIHHRLAGQNFRLATEDGGRTWQCGHAIHNPALIDGGQIDPIYLPSACRQE